MIYLTLEQILNIHAYVLEQHGGRDGIHEFGLIESAVALPQSTFFGQDLYPKLIDKAAALGFSLTANHGFVDGNKRVGLAACDIMLRGNGLRIATLDAAVLEPIFLAIADHQMTREQFTDWLRQHVIPLDKKT